MAHILVTTDYLHPGDDIDRLFHEHGHTTIHSPAGSRPAGELAELLQDVDAALIAGEPITEQMLTGAESLKVLARTGVGYDSIDVTAAAARGVVVCNTPGANSNAVAEMAMMLILMCARRAGATLDGVAKGQWPRHDTVELRGSTLGIVGLGPSGRVLVSLAAAFGMEILATTSFPDDGLPVKYCSLDELLTQSDFVSLHARPTALNAGLIGTQQLKIMKPTASLINTARGSLVDEDALAEAVRSGVIAGAGLDVTAVEPLPMDSPLRSLPDVVVVSHLAGQTVQARAEASRIAAEDVLRVLDGRPALHPVSD